MTVILNGGRHRFFRAATFFVLTILLAACERDAGFYELDASYCDNRPCVCDSHFFEGHPAKRVAVERRNGRAVCPSNYWLARDPLADFCTSLDCFCARPTSHAIGAPRSAGVSHRSDGTAYCPAGMVLRERRSRGDP